MQGTLKENLETDSGALDTQSESSDSIKTASVASKQAVANEHYHRNEADLRHRLTRKRNRRDEDDGNGSASNPTQINISDIPYWLKFEGTTTMSASIVVLKRQRSIAKAKAINHQP